MNLRIPIRLAVLSILLAAMTALAVSAADCGDAHTWDTGKIVWNEDYTAAVGEWTCSVCKDKSTVTASIFTNYFDEDYPDPAYKKVTAIASWNGTSCTDSHIIELPHEHQYSEPVFVWNTTDYTCQVQLECFVCGDTFPTDCNITKTTFPTDGHAPGYTIYVAYVPIEGINDISTRKVEGDPIGHDYSTPVFTWSEDFSSASVESICSICAPDDPERILRAECSIIHRMEEADCFSDGYGEYIARADLLGQVWEDTKTIIYAQLQHKYPSPTFLWKDGECTVVCACEYCESAFPGDWTVSEKTTYTDCTSPGTLTRTATITVDGIIYSDSDDETIPAKGHTQVRLSGKKATCTESGLTDGIGCAVCEEVLQKQTEIPAHGHTDAVVKGTAATCTEAGWTDKVFCTVCEEVLQKSTVIPPKGHTEKTVAGYAPTCTEEGRSDGKRCTVCEEVITAQIVIPALGHTPRKLQKQEPTCTEDGYSEGEICSVCEEVIVKQIYYPAPGHTKKVLKGYAATCSKDGLTDGVSCAVCEVIITEQKVIPAKGHTPSRLTGYVPTCTEAGLTDGEVCSVCHAVLKEQKTIPAKGHRPEKQDLRPATCTEPGYTEGNTCSVCHEVFLKPGVIPPKGHMPQIIEGREATCTEDGITDGSICSVCHTVLEKSVKIPAIGHTPEKKEGQAPTCEDIGYTDGTICSVCQVVLEEYEPIPPLGHTWTQPVFTWNETNDSAKAEKSCTVCEIIYSATASLKLIEMQEDGNPVTKITASVMFSDGTTASDVKEITSEPILPAPEAPANPPIDETGSAPEQGPEPIIPDPPSVIPESKLPALQFDDVAEDSYYSDAVAWAASMNITQGTADGVFSPDMVCSRAQVVTMLWRAAGSPLTEGTTSFADVSLSSYYYHAVLWATEQGITAGTSKTAFSPDLQCTRAQIVTMLWRAAGCPAVGAASTFADVSSDAWYAEAVAWAVESGITLGTGQDTFSPDAVCTRAQIVTFMYRARHLW